LLQADDEAISPHVDGDRWAGRLFTNGIALCNVKGQVLFLSRDTTQIEDKEASVVGGFQRLSIVSKERKLSCSITRDEAKRLSAWYAAGHAGRVMQLVSSPDHQAFGVGL
jgi:hypothetical protein